MAESFVASLKTELIGETPSMHEGEIARSAACAYLEKAFTTEAGYIWL